MHIRTKVIVSLIYEQRVLLAIGYDPVRDFQFYIPVGGGLDFGESLHDGALREVREELGIDIPALAFADFHESIFEFNGKPEHEIMFHFIAHLTTHEFYTIPKHGTESNGQSFEIRWLDQNQLTEVAANLVPPGILSDYQQVFEK